MIDLSKLKIEDLEEVTEGYWPEGEEMIINSENSTRRYNETVFFIKPNHEYGMVVDNEDSYSSHIFKAYKIPKPQKRERTVVEKVKYLQQIESVLKDDEILVAKYTTDKMWNAGRSLYDTILKDNDYIFAIYRSETDIEIIEIPEIEI